jgi:hypothetical protein
MKLTQGESIPALKAILKAKIDQQAESVRLQFITGGSGQAMVYQQKEMEAQRYFQDGTIGAHIQAEATATGASVSDVATMVVAMAAQWLAVSAKIEGARMGAKAAVDAATQPGPIRQAAAVDWEAVLSS